MTSTSPDYRTLDTRITAAPSKSIELRDGAEFIHGFKDSEITSTGKFPIESNDAFDWHTEQKVLTYKNKHGVVQDLRFDPELGTRENDFVSFTQNYPEGGSLCLELVDPKHKYNKFYPSLAGPTGSAQGTEDGKEKRDLGTWGKSRPTTAAEVVADVSNRDTASVAISRPEGTQEDQEVPYNSLYPTLSGNQQSGIGREPKRDIGPWGTKTGAQVLADDTTADPGEVTVDHTVGDQDISDHTETKGDKYNDVYPTLPGTEGSMPDVAKVKRGTGAWGTLRDEAARASTDVNVSEDGKSMADSTASGKVSVGGSEGDRESASELDAGQVTGEEAVNKDSAAGTVAAKSGRQGIARDLTTTGQVTGGRDSVGSRPGRLGPLSREQKLKDMAGPWRKT